MTNPRKRKQPPFSWQQYHYAKPLREINIPQMPVRTWQEFTSAEQAALLVKLRMWLDPDVRRRRRMEWTGNTLTLL